MRPPLIRITCYILATFIPRVTLCLRHELFQIPSRDHVAVASLHYRPIKIFEVTPPAPSLLRYELSVIALKDCHYAPLLLCRMIGVEA